MKRNPGTAPENEYRGGNSDSSQVLQIIHDLRESNALTRHQKTRN